ncbi:tRNA 2-thiouridine(34) synthase MnmA [Candidatus Kuenenbacteria bacterium CG22_combo_CG10-13_8_21_14_all_39_9]|uniref:tRNA-uridine 2-sulfurtransferase n=1 Tax=Candidatus Kuenenbacteria bacterium CG22_combo_CG10-13_8_21_14_all_39_9 TaxID=1974621 RepID=A0A2H0D1J1_9BACT|nr:MAG: tRNA 2-thiouridine(34) synthase MnmA [Candidatus Kuenenbacteria bacterium CG22_combo_CG10-13_8_21_14_all_39_9]
MSPLPRGRKYLLKKSPDPVKDQTYFLALLSQEQLAKALFPIGHLTKKKVRALAKKFDLPNQDRPDSQGICFLGKIKYRDFLQEQLGVRKGDIINVENGKKMGQHNGFWHYTIGQRKDIKLSGGPWYVTAKDVKKNIVYIAHGNILMVKARDEFLLGEAHWISGIKPDKKNLQVKIRHGEGSYKCRVNFLKRRVAVKLDQADTGVAAGQYAVFYDKDICLGGGVIQ